MTLTSISPPTVPTTIPTIAPVVSPRGLLPELPELPELPDAAAAAAAADGVVWPDVVEALAPPDPVFAAVVVAGFEVKAGAPAVIWGAPEYTAPASATSPATAHS